MGREMKEEEGTQRWARLPAEGKEDVHQRLLMPKGSQVFKCLSSIGINNGRHLQGGINRRR